MKQTIKQLTRYAAAIGIVTVVLTSCSKNDMCFKNAAEAVVACKAELEAVRKQKDTSIEAIGKTAARWMVMQDSCYSAFLRDTTFDYNGQMAVDFVATSDSIRDIIIDKTKSRPRTLRDVVKLKVVTAVKRSELMASKDYKDVMEFYRSLDAKPVEKNLQKALANYAAVLKIARLSQDEAELKKFLADEDFCFRSLLASLPDVTDEQLQWLTDKTAEVFKNTDESIIGRSENSEVTRFEIYITMRFNRRILQNAVACRNDIKKHRELSQKMTANYRWMILQPMISIDNDAMATVTDEQVALIEQLADELPMLMTTLDGEDYSKAKKEDVIRLTQALSNYFLNSHLKSIM